jgi:hypothetical protein
MMAHQVPLPPAALLADGAIPPVADGAPPVETWLTLVQDAEIPTYSYAAQLWQENKDIRREQAMAPITRFVVKVAGQNYVPEAALWYYADSLDQNMFLAVVDNKWEVLHGLRRCTPIQGNGGRLTCLQGDRKLLFGSLVQPGLFMKAQHTNTQVDLFTAMNVRAQSLASLEQTFDANPDKELGDPGRGPVLMGWPLLPIHSKIACLYLAGLSMAQGLKVGQKILDMIPDHLVVEKILWADQLRVGATRRAANMQVLALNVTWAGEPLRGEDPGATPLFGAGDALPLERNNEGALGELPRGDDPGAELPLDAARGGNDGLLDPTCGGDDGGPPFLLAGARGADIASATLDLLQTMTDKLSGSATRLNSRQYDWTELEYLFERIGAPKVNGSFTGLGPESVPDFFQALSSVQGDKANTCMFAERYRMNHYPKESGQYDFVWMTQLIKDLKTLSLSGDDITVSYANRYRGLSVFSLAPLSEANLD